MRHGSLFSGIGGFDLAAEWMGWENIFHCEWNPFGQKVLKYYWPDAITYTDITKTDFSIHRGDIDILTGGFPCQPYSQAGKRKGKDDDRHLWPEMLRAIREIQPGWVVGENVPGLLNWNGGMVLHEIKTDLESAGFEVLPPCILPACGKDAPHRRDRLWIVAYGSEINGEQITSNRKRQSSEQIKEGGQVRSEFTSIIENGITANSERIRSQRSRRPKRQMCSETFGNWETSWTNPNGGWPTVNPIRTGNDGIPNGLAEHSFSKTDWLKGGLESVGNAIVPQIAYEIFKAIEKTTNQITE